MIGRSKRAERGRVSLFGHHLTIQLLTRGVEAFMNVTCSRVYNRGERLVSGEQSCSVLLVSFPLIRDVPHGGAWITAEQLQINMCLVSSTLAILMERFWVLFQPDVTFVIRPLNV